MKIQIAGPGCARCQATDKIVHEVLKELNLTATVEHVYDVREYSKLGVMFTPTVLVDGKIVFAGRVPSGEEIKKAIT